MKSSSPAGGLSLSMTEGEFGVAVSGDTLLLSECVLILLAGGLHDGNKSNETEEEQKLVLVAIDGVHAIQGERFTETLVAHVERAQEAEVSHTINETLAGILRPYPDLCSGLCGVTLMLGTFSLTTLMFAVENTLRLANTLFNILLY